jgi:hypothetical protein
MKRVPNFTTLKFTPQMSAMASSPASVNQTPGRGVTSGRPGASAPRWTDEAMPAI